MKKEKLNDENIHKGYLILINPDNLLKTNEIKLISYSEKYKNIELDQVANSQLQKALKSINANDEIVPISGVRTFEEQKRLYTDSSAVFFIFSLSSSLNLAGNIILLVFKLYFSK